MKTLIKKNIKHKWYIIDAKNQILGRLASKIAIFLRGKHKIEYTPNIDIGDYIIVLNANKINITGNKHKNKIYYKHSGYPTSLKKINFENMILCNPEYIIKKAVKGMLPKGPLGRSILNKLKVYSGTDHNHISQKPNVINI